MLSYKEGRVVKILNKDKDISIVDLNIDHSIKKAMNYNKLTGEINLGDKVVVNTTAGDLSLGTGGQHFVIFNYNKTSQKLEGKGHIMKLRYTPYQIKTLSVEEEASKYHNIFNEINSLEGHPVIIGTLHSMIAPIIASLKESNNELKINYIMTDGAALPIFFSKTVSQLKEIGLINKTITIGNAFGGDYECVNLFTGLITSKYIAEGDITIISMGPGIVGTGTQYGFTGIEQGSNIDIVNSLKGLPIIVPRIGFSDKRKRHYGISHHTLTTLTMATNTKGNLIFPKLKQKELNYIENQVRDYKLKEKHNIHYYETSNISEIMDKYNLSVKTMGRGYNEEKSFFLGLSAVSNYTLNLLNRS